MIFMILFSMILGSVARIILRRERLFFRAPFSLREVKQSFDRPAWDQSSRLRFVRVFPRGLGFVFLSLSCLKNSTAAQKCNDFFAIKKIFFLCLTSDLARFMNVIIHKCLIFNDLRRAAGRASASA